MRASVPSRRMTIDETPGKGTPRGSAHEIERYGGLFARRTRGMTSSAMRDMMAVTARPEVISLATGLPDTTTFPAEDFAMLMSRVAVDSSAAALQYGPTDGLDDVRRCIVQVMAAEGTEVEIDDLMVTTGGQQVIDLVCRAFLDPGDVVVAEAPTYPGAVPCFNSYQADVVQIEMDDDGMRIDVLEATLARLRAEGRRAEVHLHDPELPEPGRRDDVARAPPRARADRQRAGARDPRGQPVRAAALRGRAAADAVLARRRALRGLRRDVLEDPLRRPAARLGRGAAADPRAAEPRQAGRRPVLLAAEPVLRRGLLRASRLAQVPRRAARDLPAPARRDARRAGGVPARARRPGPSRAAGCSSGPGCRTTSTPPTCWRARCASTSRSSPGAPRTSTAAAARRCG